MRNRNEQGYQGLVQLSSRWQWASLLFLCALGGLTCQADDICRGVDGACLAIDVDAELEALPLENVTLEALLTTRGAKSHIGDPDLSRLPLTSLPTRFRITQLPPGLTPSQLAKLELVARLPAPAGGADPGEIIASAILDPVPWSDGEQARVALKLAPLAKPQPITAAPVPSSGGTSLTLTGDRLCYRYPDGSLATTITVGNKPATITTCEKTQTQLTLPSLPYQPTGHPTLIRHSTARAVQATNVTYYPANLAFHAIRSYPLPDRTWMDPPSQAVPRFEQYPNMSGVTAGHRSAIAIGDFDGDQNIDIAFPNYGLNTATSANPKVGSIHVLWGGTENISISKFGEAFDNLDSIRPYALAVDDIDRDGVDDLLVSSFKGPGAYAGEMAGIYIIYGEKLKRAAIGNRWQKMNFTDGSGKMKSVNPYYVFADRILPMVVGSVDKNLTMIDGEKIDDQNPQADEVFSCLGLGFSPTATAGSSVPCVVGPEKPFERGPAIGGVLDGSNGFISSLSPIRPVDAGLAGQKVIDALLLTNYGKQRVSILKNKKIRTPSGTGIFAFDMNSDFSETPTGSLPGKPVGAVFADVTFDGKDDLLVALENSVLLLYKGISDRESNNFGLSSGFIVINIQNGIGNSVYIHDIAASDIDGDSKPDVVLATTSGLMIIYSKSQTFKLATGTVTEKVSSLIEVGGAFFHGMPQQLKIIDFNKDGLNDIVLMDRDATSVSVIYGNPNSDTRFTHASPLRNIEKVEEKQPFGIASFQDQGKTIIAAANRIGRSVTRFLSLGKDPCCSDNKNSQSIPTGLANAPHDVIVADFDRDGQVDYVVSHENIQSGVSVYWGDLTGGAELIDEVTSNKNTFIRAVDLNADNFDDLILLRLSSEVQLFKNTRGAGPRGFTSLGTIVPSAMDGNPLAVTSVVLKEYAMASSDNLVDLVIGTDKSKLLIYRNQGGNCELCYLSSDRLAIDVPGNSSILAIDAQYLSGPTTTGVKDLAVLTSDSIYIYQNGVPAGREPITIRLPYFVNNQIVSWAFGDLNLDGITDIVVLNANRSMISVFLGADASGQRTWTLQGSYSVGIRTTAITIVDYDRDGLPDIVAANYRGANVSLVKNLSN